MGESGKSEPLTDVDIIMATPENSDHAALSIEGKSRFFYSTIFADGGYNTPFTISIPSDAQDGVYKSSISVTSAETGTLEVPVRIIVPSPGFQQNSFADGRFTIPAEFSEDNLSLRVSVTLPKDASVRYAAMDLVADSSESPAGLSVDVGNNGTAEWNTEGHVEEYVLIEDLTPEFSQYLSSSVTRDGGDHAVEVPITITAGTSGKIGIYSISVYYDLSDADHDGMPDGWEKTYALNPETDDSQSDPDGDSLSNIQEYEMNSNPQVSDTDEDGLGDGQEYEFSSDPTKADTDGDGLDDLSEYNLQTDPNLTDTDKGGETDGSEVDNGKDPKNPVDDEIPESLFNVILILKVLAGLGTDGIVSSDADMNNDGKIGIEEAIHALQEVAFGTKSQ